MERAWAPSGGETIAMDGACTRARAGVKDAPGGLMGASDEYELKRVAWTAFSSLSKLPLLFMRASPSRHAGGSNHAAYLSKHSGKKCGSNRCGATIPRARLFTGTGRLSASVLSFAEAFSKPPLPHSTAVPFPHARYFFSACFNFSSRRSV